MELNNPYGFIYLTTNMVNGKKYIGQKIFDNNWENYLGSGIAFKNAIKKYGKDNFYKNIIYIAYSKNDLDKMEIEFIKNHNAVESIDYYNMCYGGGTTTGLKMNDIQKERISKATSGKNNPFYGKHHSDETRQKISELGKGKVISKEQREKMSKALSGKNHPLYGKHHSKEAKNKMSKAKKGKIMSDKAKNNMSKSRKGTRIGKDNPSARKIICTTTNEIFLSIVDAGKKYKLQASNISKCLRGIIPYCGKLENNEKLVWKYYDKYLNEGELLNESKECQSI